MSVIRQLAIPCTEYLETAVAVEQIKPEWTHSHTGHNQAHDVRHTNHVQQQRRKQNYHQHQKSVAKTSIVLRLWFMPNKVNTFPLSVQYAPAETSTQIYVANSATTNHHAPKKSTQLQPQIYIYVLQGSENPQSDKQNQSEHRA